MNADKNPKRERGVYWPAVPAFGSEWRRMTLDRKLALIGRTAEIATNLLQNRRMLRVEWYIVILILFEIIWNLVEFLLRR